MTTSRSGAAAAVALAAAILTGCSSGLPGQTLPGGLAPGQQAAGAGIAAQRRRAAVHLRLKIPHRARRHAAAYISQSTLSIEAIVYDAAHAHVLAKAIANTVPGSGGCTPVSGTTFTCTLTVGVPPGEDTFDVDAFDGKNATGKELSAVVDYAYGVVAGQPNDLSMTLGGIPASIDVALVGSSIFATGSQVAGFHFGGNGPSAMQQLQITAKDADGNVIVDPGAPVLTLASSDAKDLSIAAKPSASNAFDLTPLAQSNGAIELTATATSVKSGTSLQAKVKVNLDPILYEISCWNTTVGAYAPWSTQPILTLTGSNGIAANSALALDAAGNLYLANYLSSPDGAVLEFAPGSTKASRTITNLNDPNYLAVDANGNVYVVEGNSEVQEFASTASGSAAAVRTLDGTGISSPYGLAVDAQNNLYVANAGGGVSIFPPGTATAPSASFSAGMNSPQWLALDGTGNLYVGNAGAGNITEYLAPLKASSTVAHTFGSSAAISSLAAIAVDGLGDVYAVSPGNSTVVEYSPSQSLLRTIGGLGLDGTNLVAVDSMGNAYVPDENTQSVGVYAPGTSTTASPVYSAGMDGPMDVAVWP